MASIKIKFRPSATAGREGTLSYQIIQGRQVRRIPTGCRLLPAEWDARRATPLLLPGSPRQQHLLAVRERIRLDTERLADERPPPRVRPPAVHPVPLTLYVARHSWASAARSKGIPLSVISGGMGHDSEATTRIYFATLDTAAVDRANTLILDSLT